MAQRILQQSREAESALADALAFDDQHCGDSMRPSRKGIGIGIGIGMSIGNNHSDDSETSSVCSERSYDSYRRPSDSYSWSGSQQRLARDAWETGRPQDPAEIVTNCASTVWQERKEGLIALQHFLVGGGAVPPAELRRLTDVMTKMFMDPHTKVLSLFLDALNELLIRHSPDLHDWLYVLLQRLFNKLGTEVIGSLNKKLMRTLEVVRSCFPAELQLAAAYRFLLDSTQTPNARVKTAALTFARDAAKLADPGKAPPPPSAAFSKIATCTQDGKSAELRSAARHCLLALFDANTPAVTMLLTDLPKPLQEYASQLLSTHIGRGGGGGGIGGGGGDACNLVAHDDGSAGLTSVAVEIQNYYDRDRDTTSQDSGISETTATAAARTPDDADGTPTPDDVNSDDYDELTVVQNVVDMRTDAPYDEQRRVLQQLLRLLVRRRHSEPEQVVRNFKFVLKTLLDLLQLSAETKVKIDVLKIIAELFLNEHLLQQCLQFMELLVLRVLLAHGDPNKEVVRVAESTAASAMAGCPFAAVVSMLTPIMSVQPYPVNQGAIKMLKALVEHHPDQITDRDLQEVMPALIQAYDHEESPVRKCAVFCMVAIHTAVGEERIAPYLTSLVGSKMKLLHLYIKRAQNTSSAPTSPKNNAAV